MLGGYDITIDKFISDRVLNKISEFNRKGVLSVDCASNDGEWHSDSEIKIDKLGYVICNGSKTKEFWDGKISCDNKPLRLKIRNICGDETVWEISKK